MPSKKWHLLMVSTIGILACLNLAVSVVFLTRAGDTTSKLVSPGAGGKLEYTPYANRGEISEVNVIPDFSHAGYRRGGVTLPEVPTSIVLDPVPGDNTAHVQDAINQVAALPVSPDGTRGAILLRNGTYEIQGELEINASGIVLRGQGQGSNGTVLKALKQEKHDFITIHGAGSGLPGIDSTRRNITATIVPTGMTRIPVNDSSGYNPGDHVNLVRTPNDRWIDDLAMRQYNWTAGAYAIKHERIVTGAGVMGVGMDAVHYIDVDIPVVDPLLAIHGGGYIEKANVSGRISNCGVERLRVESYYEHLEDEDHGWNAVVLSRVEHCWVRQVTARYFGFACVNVMDESNFNTIQDCAMIDPVSITTGGRKYSFNIKDGLGNLFQRCYCRGGRHDFATGSRVTGPNAWVDCVAEDTHDDIGPHHRWATGILFDNIAGGHIRVRNRRASGTGHGWAGAQVMFWHCHAPRHDIVVESPPHARNWGIGCSAGGYSGDGYWELFETNVEPRSLYLQQLEDRLGAGAVDNITVPCQRAPSASPCWDAIRAWQGEGTPAYL